MKKIRFAGLLVMLGLLVFGCKEGGSKRGPLTPTSSGLPYELLVVIDQKYKDTEFE